MIAVSAKDVPKSPLRIRDVFVFPLTLFVIGLSTTLVDGWLRQCWKVTLRGEPESGDLLNGLNLVGMTMPDFLGAGMLYELAIANRTSQTLHHCVIELNGVEQPLPDFPETFPDSATCVLVSNHDWSNLKQGWTPPRADGHRFPTTLKFRCDECAGEWKIDIKH